jgi:cephalosporin hydroxylase
MKRTLRPALVALAIATCAASTATGTSRIKDLASIEGIRQNQLIGYGLVVGLNGTGDTLNNTPFGTEFGVDVLLTCQGAPSLMRWRGTPLMKNVFDFAMYPALIAELRPRTIFEVGSGLGASAAWFADNLALCAIEGQVHSVDLVVPATRHPGGEFHRGDCSEPQRLFGDALLRAAPHPWLVVEDAHHNVGAVLEYFHGYVCGGDYLVVEDSDVKREALRRTFLGGHPGDYLVDTHFTDYFGRNATCAADSIFVRTPPRGD